MIRFILLNYLILKNHISAQGIASFLTQQLVFIPVQILTISAVYNLDDSFSLQSLAIQYPYFTSYFGISIGIFSWQHEVYSHAYTQYVSASWFTSITSRISYFAAEFLGLFCLLLYSIDSFATLVHAVATCLIFSLVGSMLGKSIGFRHEKSLNNLNHLMKWLLAFGSGLVVANNEAISSLDFLPMPLVKSSASLEAAKLLGIATIALIAASLLSRQRRSLFRS